MLKVFVALSFATAIVAQHIEWRTDLGSSKVSQVHVSDDFVFVHGSNTLFALNQDDGSIHNQLSSEHKDFVPLHLQAFESQSTTHYLLSTYSNGDMVAYDTRLDESMWTMHKVLATSPPVIDRDHGGVAIYMLTESGWLMAVDAMSRFPIWSIKTKMPTSSKLHLSTDNEKLYIQGSDGQVQVHSSMDGSLLASPYFEDKEASFIVGDFLYLFNDGEISVYSIDDCDSPLWTANDLGTLLNVIPMEDDKHVLLLTSTGLHKIKHWSGKMKWCYMPQDTMRIVSFNTEGSSVYILLQNSESRTTSSSSSLLVKLNGVTGDKDWDYSLSNLVRGETMVGSDLMVHHESVYITTQDETMTSSHLVKLMMTPTDEILQPAVGDGGVVVEQ